MKKILSTISKLVIGIVIGVLAIDKMHTKLQGKNLETQVNMDKYKKYYDILHPWLALKQEEASLEPYFVDHNYNTIAIYGMADLGKRLFEELDGTSVDIKYVIDKFPENVYSKVPCVGVEDVENNVDAVIVTATFAMNSIKPVLEKKVTCPIISLEDVVDAVIWKRASIRE